jgi:hypothetical protein
MTPRKELYIKIKQALTQIPQLELVDLQRKQFSNPKENYPTYWTAALIEIKAVRWESMVENKQEGECTVDVILYTKDGWLDQHDTTADAEHGLVEIDLQDAIVENLQFLKGDYFKPLELTNEANEDEDSEMMSYRLSFSTLIYRRINPKFSNRKLTLIP